MKNKRIALLAGATGLIGHELLQILLADEVYEKVKTLSRKAIKLENPKLEQIIVNFDHLDDVQDMLKADDVFCCLGTTMKQAGSKEKFYKVDYEYTVEISKEALRLGAKQFLLVSSMGADGSSAFYYNQVKGQLEETIKKLKYQAVHIFRPSLLLGERKEGRLGEYIAQQAMKTLGFLMIGPLRKYRGIEGKKVAEAMVITAKKDLTGIHLFESDTIQNIKS